MYIFRFSAVGSEYFIPYSENNVRTFLRFTGTVYFQSIGSAKKSIVLSLLRQVIVFIPLILVVPKYFGLNGVWAAQPLADVVSMIIIGLFLIKEFKYCKL